MATEEERKAAFERLVIDNARLEKELSEALMTANYWESMYKELSSDLAQNRASMEEKWRASIESNTRDMALANVRAEVLQTLAEKFGWQWYD